MDRSSVLNCNCYSRLVDIDYYVQITRSRLLNTLNPNLELLVLESYFKAITLFKKLKKFASHFYAANYSLKKISSADKNTKPRGLIFKFKTILHDKGRIFNNSTNSDIFHYSFLCQFNYGRLSYFGLATK